LKGDRILLRFLHNHKKKLIISDHDLGKINTTFITGAFVIGTTSTEAKAAIAREAGADEVILYSQKDFVEEVNRITDGKGVNVIYDGIGKTTFQKGIVKNACVMHLYQYMSWYEIVSLTGIRHEPSCKLACSPEVNAF